MRYLNRSTDGNRLSLVLPDELPLRAAAKAIRTCRFEGRDDGLAVFSFAATPDVAHLVVQTFEPEQAPPAQPLVEKLLKQHDALEAAVQLKEQSGGAVAFNPHLIHPPMAHQVEALNFCWARWNAGAKGSALLMEQGTGKSLVAIGLANALYTAGLIQWVLVIGPNSLKGTWGAEDGEIRKHSALGAEPVVMRGTRQQRVDWLEDVLDTTHHSELMPWVVTNYEQFGIDFRKRTANAQLFRRFSEIARREPGLLVIDESTMVKNPTARRTQAVGELARSFPYKLILTGTPVTRSPLDVFAQFEVLEPGALGFSSYLAFERLYALKQQRRAQGRRFFEVVGYQNLDDLEHRVAKLSYRARADECLDLPDVVVKNIPVTMSHAQAKTLRQLKGDMMAELDNGQLVDGRNILTRYLRMAQTIGGHVHTLNQDGTAGPLEAFDPNPKLDAAMEYLSLLFEDSTRKAVVFCQYTAEIEALRDACRAKDWKPVAFYGAVSETDREEGRKRFKNDPATRVFIAQYQTGSKGLTLVEASDVVFYSLTFSLEDFLQAKKRVHRIGQTRTVTEAYLVGQTDRGRTLDHVIVEALRAKKNLADVVTGDAARKALEAM